MYYLYEYQLSPEIPPGAHKFDIVEVSNENKLVMSFLEDDFSINQYLHSLPNAPEALAALEAIRNASVIYVGVEPNPHPGMYTPQGGIVYISCDNVTPYAAGDGRIFTVWFGPNFEASDTRYWDRNVDATALVDTTPVLYNPAPETLSARYYQSFSDIVLDPSRMGIVVRDDITLSFSYEDLAQERRTLNTEDMMMLVGNQLASSLSVGPLYATLHLLLVALDPLTTTYDSNNMFTVADASQHADIDSGPAVFFYNHTVTQMTGTVTLTRVWDDDQLDVDFSLAAFAGGPQVNGSNITSEDFDLLTEYDHGHAAGTMAIAADITVNGDGFLEFNGVQLGEGYQLEAGSDQW